MNKRIKELADCAFDDLENDPVIIFKPEDLKEFAELIIRECITVTKNVENGYSDYRNQIEDGMKEAIISNIEHHFGVNNEPKV